MDHSTHTARFDRRNIIDYLVTFILFCITVLLSLFVFFALPESVQLFLIYVIVQNGDARYIHIRDTLLIARMVFIVVASMILVIVFYGGLGYHFEHTGTRRSYRVFAWTIGLEVGVLVVYQVLLRVVFV